jgi:hexosaminidase
MSVSGCQNSNSSELNQNPNSIIIPQPTSFLSSLEVGISFENGVKVTGGDSLLSEINYLQQLLKEEHHISLEISEVSSRISLKVLGSLPKNSHHISCENQELKIYGGSPEAVFNGIQSFHQLLIIKNRDSEITSLSAFELSDTPKFKWRGMLLDVCRHYFPKEVVLKYIDLLAFYKMNVLHWHITEDQAWRIAVDAYPKLTEIGAWREDVSAKNGELYGGYYSKEDIREIVEYASKRHIQIVPEIEMPGHSSAAVSAYPELGCNGEQISVPNDWGVFKDIYCPTEYTFEFLETVLGEVMELFPSDYVHIGGDEAPKTRWEESAFCQNLMKKEGLSDYEELQSYFINRMAQYLEENGKTIIGWDEILNDELTETAIIQSWRGMDGGRKAVSEGRQAIMSPTSHCYLDYSLKAIDTEKIYGFDPIPPNCTAEEEARILGAECNMWTEHVPDEKTLDSKVFPRLIAAAESFWGTNDDYEGFVKRLDAHYVILEEMGVQYGNETVAISFETQTSKNGITVKLEENFRNPQTTYSLTNSYENHKTTQAYKGENIQITQNGKNTLQLQARTELTSNYEPSTLNFNLHNWLTASTNYSVPYSDYYTAGGDDGLTDGVLGSLDFRDGHWQGFFGEDIELIIKNPNTDKTTSSVSMNFYRYINSWIFPPESVLVSASTDGKMFAELDSYSYAEEEMHIRGQEILSPSFSFSPVNANYLKVSVKNIGKVPHWHEASSEPAWIFVDEIIIN